MTLSNLCTTKYTVNNFSCTTGRTTPVAVSVICKQVISEFLYLGILYLITVHVRSCSACCTTEIIHSIFGGVVLK
jgi:hypothetical protein